MKVVLCFALVLITQLAGIYGSCPFARTAYKSSQDIRKNQQAIFNELWRHEYTKSDFRVTLPWDTPGWEVSRQFFVEPRHFNDLERSSLIVKTTELLNHQHSNSKKCSDLSEYSSCFTPEEICYNTTDITCDANSRYRTLGGTCNNLENPILGSQFAAFGRLLPPNYHDCVHSERRTFVENMELPSARVISNRLFDSPEKSVFGGVWKSLFTSDDEIPSTSVMNIFGLWFGQAVTHDAGSRLHTQRSHQLQDGISCCSLDGKRFISEELRHPQCRPISIPEDDSLYSQFGARCHNYVRSQVAFPNDCKIGPAEKTNIVSAFYDLTIVYGDDEDVAKDLRTFKSGKLRTNDNNILPMYPGCKFPTACYILGDTRLIQTPLLAQQHSLLLRLHNLIAENFSKLFGYDDETAYEEARRLTVALFQQLTYNEWIPWLLGESHSRAWGLTCNPSKEDCGRYDSQVDPSTTNDFTHGAFRLLHKFTPATIELLNPDNSLNQSFDLSDFNINRNYMLEEYYDHLLRGSLKNPINLDGYTAEVRGKIFKDSRGVGFDLLAVDIQRGRDHGVPAFIDYLSLTYGYPIDVQNWQDLLKFFDADTILQLREIYDSPQDIDLLVGVMLEKFEENTLSGPVGRAIMAEQFRRLKFGDRFFYQWRDGPYPFTTEQFEQIESFSAAKWVCMVTDFPEVPKEAFATTSRQNELVNCDDHRDFDFSVFKKEF